MTDKLQFYYPYSPTAIEDANEIKDLPLKEKLNYLKERLKTIEYIDLKKGDPMESPDVMFTIGWGDCEDRVAYVATVLSKIGVSHTVYVGKAGSPLRGHVWIEIEDYLFETTIPEIYKKGTEKIKYYPEYYIYCNSRGDITAG